MWQRNASSHSQYTTYLNELRKLQLSNFYSVHVGQTKIGENLVDEDITPVNRREGNQLSWSIIHAGGALGWVPWNYKLYFDDMKLKPDEDIFQELCTGLKDYYGNCAIIVNPDMRERQNNKSGNSAYPTSPLKLLPMTCCPEVAQSFGHKMLLIPMHRGYLSPLSTAWSTAKWFILNHKGYYTETFYHKGFLQKTIHFNELVDAALNEMT